MGSYFVIKAEVKQGNKNSSCTLYHVERYNEKIHGVRDVTNCNGKGFQFMINSPIPISVEVVMCLLFTIVVTKTIQLTIQTLITTSIQQTFT